VEPFYNFCDEGDLAPLVLSGEYPAVDDRWMIHTAERSLAHLLRTMRAFDPMDRPGIEEVIQRLHETLSENESVVL